MFTIARYTGINADRNEVLSMRNFLYRMSSSLARFMYGRNGADQLNTALLALYLVIWLLEVLLARQALAALSRSIFVQGSRYGRECGMPSMLVL